MEKRVLYGLVVILMYLVNSGFSQGEVEWISEEVKWEQFLTKAKLRPIVVMVTSMLCGLPCALLKDQVSQLAKLYDDDILFYTIDILEKPFFAQRYKVINVPTLIVFKGGIEIKRLEKYFYWGAVYDLIYKANILFSAPPPSDSAPAPFDSTPPRASLLEALDELGSWEETLVETQLPIVVTVTSSLCGAPCVILMDQVTRLAETYGKQVKFYTADILVKPFFAQLFNVVNVPTLIVFKYGKEVSRFEKLSDWGNIYDLVYTSVFDPSSPNPSPLGQ